MIQLMAKENTDLFTLSDDKLTGYPIVKHLLVANAKS